MTTDKTLIPIDKETAKMLKAMKRTQLETYDEIIRRLLLKAQNSVHRTRENKKIKKIILQTI